MSEQGPSPSVHRLLDIVVEEVSLVDRAANLRRFLIVKRGDPMDQQRTHKAEPAEAPGEPTAQGNSEPEAAATAEVVAPDDSLLEAAVTALERLTETVETLGTLGDGEARARVADIAGELRALAEQLVSAVGGSAEPPAPDKARDLVGVLETVRATLQQVGSLIDANKAARPRPKKTPEDEEGGAACKTDAGAAPRRAADDALAGHLHRLAEAVSKIAHSVGEQSQRLAKLEKSFGLPHSTPAREGRGRAPDEDVGWPMDLNRPFDRESVDKAISFHDL